MKLKSLLFSSLIMTAYFSNAQCPQITCPSDISVSTDPGSCDAAVTYTAPVGTDPCAGNTQTFTYTGAVQTFTVPTGVTSIDVDMVGASGSIGADPYGFTPGQGGSGARVQTTIAVTPGEVLNIYVGGEGALNLGGFNGGGDGGTCDDPGELGGGGGGASDIRQGGTTLNDRIVVAGGGGGGGASGQEDNASNQSGGDGGDAGEVGMDGAAAECGSTSGLAGTATAGGTGGTGAGAGALGIGGVGADCGAVNYYGDGGGGGGGYYGGGGGGSSTAQCTAGDDPGGAGGGGGSSYSAGTNTTFTSGFNTGDGEITLTWGGTSSVTTTQIAGQASGSTFALGTNVQTFEVSDGNGNTDQCSFNIIVTDNNDPVADNANLADVEASCEVNSLTAPTATDLCDGSITGVSDAVFPIDSDTVVVWTYTDAEGNAVTQNQNVVITGVDVGVSLSGATITADNGNADSYQWINCADSSTVTDATGQSFTPSTNGDYAVIITEGNCSDTSACETVSTVGIEDFGNNQSISIYPNPNAGQFSVNFKKEITQAEVIVYDLQGRIVESYITKNTSTQMINLEEHSGTFTITVTTEKGTQNFRVVVQ